MSALAFKPFSLEDDAFVQGGLLQDVDVEIVSAQWVPWDYGKPGVVSEDVLAARLGLVVLGEDRKPVTGPDGHPEAAKDQYWSAGGNFADVTVSDDGLTVGAGTKTALTKGSNFHLFLQSLREHGMPSGFMEGGSLANLVGIKFHLVRKPAPARPGISNQRANKEDQTIPVCGAMISGPWKPGAAKGGKATPAAAKAGAAAATPAPATPVATDEETEATAERLIREVLAAEPNQTVAKLSDLKVKVFRKATTDKAIPADKRNIVGKLAENGAWIEERAIASVSSSGEVTLL